MKKENETETVVVPESVLKSPPPPPPPPETFPDIEIKVKPASTSESSDSAFEITPDDLVDTPVSAAPAVPLTSSEEQIRDGTAQLKILNVPAIELSKYCKLCDISVTSEMHMRLHLAGAKHAKKLRQLGEPPYSEVPHTLSQCILEETTTKRPKNINTTAVDGGANALDYSVFRTPSGQYYCQTCDLSVTSEVTLGQHFASKRHMKAIKRK